MLWAARRLSLAAVLVACAGVVLFVGMGTLFFDDPRASYPEFLLVYGVIPVMVFSGAGFGARWMSRTAERRGWPRAAIAAALVPALVVLGDVVRISLVRR